MHSCRAGVSRTSGTYCELTLLGCATVSGALLCLHLDGLDLGHSPLPTSVGKAGCDAGVEAETSRGHPVLACPVMPSLGLSPALAVAPAGNQMDSWSW